VQGFAGMTKMNVEMTSRNRMTNSPTTKKNLVTRPPVVAVMGHIDHGKSTLLDTIRKSRITAKEAGGITQHVGAYEVEQDHNGKKMKITFLDTPGHEAFCSVRERGAKIADIAILIVSAEDGVKPQTLEAVKCIRDSETPFIVAINKIDSPKANVDLAKASLIENEIYLEGMGGDISFVEISAKEGTKLDELIDLILLTAEVEDFMADPNGEAEGFVVEAQKDKRKGNSATLILKNGTLTIGKFIATNNSYSPVRSLVDQDKKNLDKVTFSTPFSVFGFDKLPNAGDLFKVFENKKEAEDFASQNPQQNPESRIQLSRASTLMERNPESDQTNEAESIIPLIIKTDVVGSKEAIEYELGKLKLENIKFKILKSDTGDISEADAKLAATNELTIIAGFNVNVDIQANHVIERNNIPVKTFDIIYEVTDWIESTAVEKKPKVMVIEEIGQAKVLKVFGGAKKQQVVGGKVREGKIETRATFLLMRRNEKIDTGIVKGLQKAKEKVTLVTEGEEFGSAVECKTPIAESDIFLVSKEVEK
jgi:translation initiation factor IF-2